ncbi:hypothetical protein [Sediminibacterium goheungense]|uniref:CDP-glycerol:poly(Glycerophosphate) glycerophosphotransferase n=1 Tax=Sediminibacterium goheungense TaxID=1086393 RepID=A0A4R6IX13_9BACT|nr:hypothetical protein [Sediminibacterium goheungense]TDO26911.1 hypothetical protein BC659_2226 [Sediminibacterium goheungense]
MNTNQLIRNIVKNKRIAFVFGDPAGAKAMIAISKLIRDSKEFLLISDRSYSFFSEIEADVSIVINEEELFSKFADFAPQLIFTGTSLPVSVELKSLKYGKQNNIETLSFVDHWTNIKERFIDEKGQLIIPDKVYVIDSNAYNIAVKDGLPEKQVEVISNPYYNWLSTWKPKTKRYSFYQQLGINQDAAYIVYAPEPLDKFNLKEKYGFNEYDILNDVDKIFKNYSTNSKKEIKIVFKTHPNVKKEEVLKAIILNLGYIPDYLIIISDIDFNHLIYYSSLVIGFFSNSLIEASILGKPIFRLLYKLNRIENDPLNGKEIGVRIDSLKKFSEILNKKIL